MNERVQELAKEASRWYLANATEFSSPAEWNEKFAELIVKECEVALNPPVQVRNVISRGQAYDLIKQHFGVE